MPLLNPRCAPQWGASCCIDGTREGGRAGRLSAQRPALCLDAGRSSGAGKGRSRRGGASAQALGKDGECVRGQRAWDLAERMRHKRASMYWLTKKIALTAVGVHERPTEATHRSSRHLGHQLSTQPPAGLVGPLRCAGHAMATTAQQAHPPLEVLAAAAAAAVRAALAVLLEPRSYLRQRSGEL